MRYNSAHRELVVFVPSPRHHRYDVTVAAAVVVVVALLELIEVADTVVVVVVVYFSFLE